MSGSWPGGWERRWSPLVTVVPYVSLAVLVGVTVVVKYSAVGSLLADLGLCALAAAWMLVMFTLRPAWRDRTPAMVVFFAVLMAIVAVLVIRDPWFGFFAPAGYFYAFRVLRWPWLPAGVAVVAMIAGTAQAYALDKNTVAGVLGYLAVLLVNVLPMSGYAWYVWRANTRNAERNQALLEVSEANRRLEATLAENERLHRQLVAQARQAGVLDERQRMAREIHDTLAQGLIGIITQLQAAQLQADGPAGAGSAEWQRHLDAATKLARESLVEARRSVHALRPEPLETARLGDALADTARRWSALHGVPVAVTTTGTARPVPPESEVALLRTAQEALANVARHAAAGRVGLTLSYLEREVALDVRDDGRGFQPDRRADTAPGEVAGGFGLVAMRQRVENLSGTLQIESEPGAGTAVSARIPIGEAR